jgi:predicted SAM-dependent methyltransferase
MKLGLGLHVAMMRAWYRWQRRRRHSARRPSGRQVASRVHIGSGALIRDGWVNVDLDYYAGVDYVLDVREGLPFQDVAYIYAEHFLEHLTFDEGLRFLKECRRALLPAGVLRLSTPNLDWVHATQYAASDAVANCFAMNKAFRGWGHQFLYNLETLSASLRAAGFSDVRSCRYRESSDPILQNLEEHEAYPDTESIPHVIIVEALGNQPASYQVISDPLEDYDRALHP